MPSHQKSASSQNKYPHPRQYIFGKCHTPILEIFKKKTKFRPKINMRRRSFSGDRRRNGDLSPHWDPRTDPRLLPPSPRGGQPPEPGWLEGGRLVTAHPPRPNKPPAADKASAAESPTTDRGCPPPARTYKKKGIVPPFNEKAYI